MVSPVFTVALQWRVFISPLEVEEVCSLRVTCCFHQQWLAALYVDPVSSDSVTLTRVSSAQTCECAQTWNMWAADRVAPNATQMWPPGHLLLFCLAAHILCCCKKSIRVTFWFFLFFTVYHISASTIYGTFDHISLIFSHFCIYHLLGWNVPNS